MKGFKKAILAAGLLALLPAFAGGFFAVGYQSAGSLELGGGGFGACERFYFGGEGHGGLAGYGYGLGFVGYRVYTAPADDLQIAVVLRLGLGGGGGRGWGGFLVEPGVWVLAEKEGGTLGLLLAYQYAPGHQGVLLRLTLGGGR